MPSEHPPQNPAELAAMSDAELFEAARSILGRPQAVNNLTRKTILKVLERKENEGAGPADTAPGSAAPLAPPAPPSMPPGGKAGKAAVPAWRKERKANPEPPTTSFQLLNGSIQVNPIDANVAWAKLQPKLKADVVVPNCAADPCPPGHTRWVCISDTHGFVNIEDIPAGDVLLHAGDLTDTGSLKQVNEFCSWMAAMPHAHKVVIAGNHDITLDPEYYADSFQRFHYKGKQDDAAAVKAMRECEAFTYLEDSSASVLGYSVYGSPWQPEFCDWAFNLGRGEPCAKRWREIPTETEVLVTHGPPVGHGDLCKGSGQRAGCVDLLAEVTNRIHPLYHVFGHVHEGYGHTTDGTTNFINASTCTFNYKPTNAPIVFDLPDKE